MRKPGSALLLNLCSGFYRKWCGVIRLNTNRKYGIHAVGEVGGRKLRKFEIYIIEWNSVLAAYLKAFRRTFYLLAPFCFNVLEFYGTNAISMLCPPVHGFIKTVSRSKNSGLFWLLCPFNFCCCWIWHNQSLLKLIKCASLQLLQASCICFKHSKQSHQMPFPIRYKEHQPKTIFASFFCHMFSCFVRVSGA